MIIPDREHIVQIGLADALKLAAFAARPNGAMRLGSRLVVEAVEGGGLLIRTKPVGPDAIADERADLRAQVKALPTFRFLSNSGRVQWVRRKQVLALFKGQDVPPA